MTTTRRLVAALALALLSPAATLAQDRTSNGVIVPVGDGFVRLEVAGDGVVRVAAAKDKAFFDRKSLATDGIPRSAATFDVWPKYYTKTKYFDAMRVAGPHPARNPL